MPIFACPQCRQALRGDGFQPGQQVTCPRCRKDVRVPALQPNTQNDLQLAQHSLEALHRESQDAAGQRDALQARIRRVRRRLERLKRYGRTREALAVTFPKLLWMAVAVLGLAGIAFAASLSLELSQGLVAGASLVAGFLGFFLVYVYFTEPSDDELKATVDALVQSLSASEATLPQLVQTAEITRKRYAKQKAIFLQLRDLSVTPTLALAARPWPQMSGIEFEVFLADVFRDLGYAVQTTRASRDHGVDLIAIRGDVKIAIQAKGFPAGGTIGNEVVLKTLGGMMVYGCNRAAVITNSTFTSAAIEAARCTTCLLVDKHRIPDLIRGRFV